MQHKSNTNHALFAKCKLNQNIVKPVQVKTNITLIFPTVKLYFLERYFLYEEHNGYRNISCLVVTYEGKRNNKEYNGKIRDELFTTIVHVIISIRTDLTTFQIY